MFKLVKKINNYTAESLEKIITKGKRLTLMIVVKRSRKEIMYLYPGPSLPEPEKALEVYTSNNPASEDREGACRELVCELLKVII